LILGTLNIIMNRFEPFWGKKIIAYAP